MVAAGIYLAYTGFDLTRAVIGSSEKNKWVFLAFAVLFCVWSDGYCYECQRHDTGLQRWQEREKIRRQRGGFLLRIGMGYDVHNLTEGRELILGGVKIPYEKGLLGHSDADVLLHAVMDALLGAASLGDIGLHFPDTDEAYRGVSSLKLLKRVGELLDEHLYVIENIDATIIAERPKMRPYIDEMRENIARALTLNVDQVNIKATTEEGLGFTGKGEGVSSQAICCIEKMTNFSYDVTEQGTGCRNCQGCGISKGQVI